MASGCVFNNFIDRDIDKLMQRTKNRLTARDLVSSQVLILYSAALGIVGVLDLYVFTNNLTTSLALIGLFFYAGAYTLWYKRKSSLGAIIGSVSGAVPPVVGYCAVSNSFDSGALILFLTLCLWQLPHSYAIAIRRLDDYRAANIPVLPLKKGVYYTKVQMLITIVLFTVCAAMLTVLNYTGIFYLIVILLLGITWFYLGVKGFKTQDDNIWARKMFLFSIIVIMIFSLILSIKI